MSAATGKSHNSVSINLNLGNSSFRVRTYPLDESDAVTQAAVIDSAVQRILDEWPRFVYGDQLHQLVRELWKQSQKE